MIMFHRHRLSAISSALLWYRYCSSLETVFSVAGGQEDGAKDVVPDEAATTSVLEPVEGDTGEDQADKNSRFKSSSSTTSTRTATTSIPDESSGPTVERFIVRPRGGRRKRASIRAIDTSRSRSAVGGGRPNPEVLPPSPEVEVGVQQQKGDQKRNEEETSTSRRQPSTSAQLQQAEQRKIQKVDKQKRKRFGTPEEDFGTKLERLGRRVALLALMGNALAGRQGHGTGQRAIPSPTSTSTSGSLSTSSLNSLRAYRRRPVAARAMASRDGYPHHQSAPPGSFLKGANFL
ncbi:unnamed protein product [Amoebophrya sp. A25]|nr:unnamed protein product [Amoebophrya sp. A25]|eukprot:GSA25T00004611001.1